MPTGRCQIPGFQSQCGSIGTGPGRLRLTQLRKFQSQCGSIGTCGASPLSPRRSGFTPSVVRLARRVPPGREGARGPFQSQCGSIGTMTQREGITHRIMFQSQCGSIGTRLAVASACVLLLVSIPVWFDWHLSMALACSRGGKFQSQCGSLGTRSIPTCTAMPNGCFNPSVVRLALRDGVAVNNHVCRFNPSVVRLAQVGRLASFPQAILVSIPVWFDWHQPIWSFSSRPPRVSIPVWFDWHSYRTVL